MTERKLRELAEEHYDRIFRAARFLCGDLQVAEDLAQETFLAAAKSLAGFEGRSSPYTWLYGILLNKFRRWMRRKRGATVSLHGMTEDDERLEEHRALHADYPDPGQVAERKETAELVRQAVASLSADHRSVIAMRYVEGLSYQEIAQVLDCPVGTVKSRIHYALRGIAAELTPPDQA